MAYRDGDAHTEDLVQRAMECVMLGIKFTDRVPTFVMRRWTKVQNIGDQTTDCKFVIIQTYVTLLIYLTSFALRFLFSS